MLVKKHDCKLSKVKNLIERFIFKVPFKDLTSDYFIPGGIVKAAKSDLSDDKFVHDAISIILSSLTGSSNVVKDFEFEINPSKNGFFIESNIDFSLLNKKISLQGGFDGEFKMANILGYILEAKADAILASHYGGEFYTSILVRRS